MKKLLLAIMLVWSVNAFAQSQMEQRLFALEDQERTRSFQDHMKQMDEDAERLAHHEIWDN